MTLISQEKHYPQDVSAGQPRQYDKTVQVNLRHFSGNRLPYLPTNAPEPSLLLSALGDQPIVLDSLASFEPLLGHSRLALLI